MPMGLQSSSCNVRRITRFVRKLRGGAQSSLVVADNGVEYAVKFNSNPQGINLLFNEVLGSELYRALGLPTADWALFQVEDEDLDRNPSAWFELPGGKQRPSAGLHFGSKIIGEGTASRYEIIPRSWLSRLENRDQFWLAMVVDVWAEHADHRQAIFTPGPDNGTLSATFFDHGHMFQGATGVQPFKSTAAMFLEKDIYEVQGARKAVEEGTQRIESLNADFVFKALARVPLEWQPTSAESVCERLLRRRSQIDGFMAKEMMALTSRNRSYGSTTRDRQVLLREQCRGLGIPAVA